jgi:integrase
VICTAAPFRLERAERPQKPARAPKRILDMDEIRQLLSSCQDRSKGRNRLIIALALNAGLRQSEILGLLWGNVDFKAKTIGVDGQLERCLTSRVSGSFSARRVRQRHPA